MANKRVEPDKKVYPLWASVTIDVKKAIEDKAKELEMTPAKLAGKVLTEYAKTGYVSALGKGGS